MTDPTTMTFEDGYARLQEISTRVTSEEVPVAEMCDLFAEGRGLQHALTAYLEEQKSRVEAIERGEGIQAFKIVAPAPSPRTTTANASAAVSSGGPSAADDDIPF